MPSPFSSPCPSLPPTLFPLPHTLQLHFPRCNCESFMYSFFYSALPPPVHTQTLSSYVPSAPALCTALFTHTPPPFPPPPRPDTRTSFFLPTFAVMSCTAVLTPSSLYPPPPPPPFLSPLHTSSNSLLHSIRPFIATSCAVVTTPPLPPLPLTRKLKLLPSCTAVSTPPSLSPLPLTHKLELPRPFRKYLPGGVMYRLGPRNGRLSRGMYCMAHFDPPGRRSILNSRFRLFAHSGRYLSGWGNRDSLDLRLRKGWVKIG